MLKIYLIINTGFGLLLSGTISIHVGCLTSNGTKKVYQNNKCKDYLMTPYEYCRAFLFIWTVFISLRLCLSDDGKFKNPIRFPYGGPFMGVSNLLE